MLEEVHEKKRTLLRLQWLAAVATSYLLLFKKGEPIQDPWVLGLVVIILGSTLLIHRFPAWTFDHQIFAPGLMIWDTVLISAAIALNRESPWDHFIVFFFGLFIAAIGQNLMKIVAACLVVSILSVLVNRIGTTGIYQLDPDLIFRIPFLFGVSILYGHLAVQARKEKERAEKAEETQNLKRQLVSALAHDIKNPLGVIMGYAETLRTDVENCLPAEKIEFLQRIEDNAQRIVKLVTGFLEASKAETGRIALAPLPVQLNTLIREVGQQQIGELRKKNISLVVELGDNIPEIPGDEVQIDRVLWNLVGNAIKFTPAGGAVKIASWHENRHVCVSVTDTGPGIPREELPLLFKEFRRLKGSARVEGTGLGLFVVKTIVEAHGGGVEAESEQGKGSTFTVRLPIHH